MHEQFKIINKIYCIKIQIRFSSDVACVQSFPATPPECYIQIFNFNLCLAFSYFIVFNIFVSNIFKKWRKKSVKYSMHILYPLFFSLELLLHNFSFLHRDNPNHLHTIRGCELHTVNSCSTALHIIAPYRVKGIEFFFSLCENFFSMGFLFIDYAIIVVQRYFRGNSERSFKINKSYASVFSIWKKRCGATKNGKFPLKLQYWLSLHLLLPVFCHMLQVIKNQRKNGMLKFWCSISKEMKIFFSENLMRWFQSMRTSYLTRLNEFHLRITRGNRCCELSCAFYPSSLEQEICIESIRKKSGSICKKVQVIFATTERKTSKIIAKYLIVINVRNFRVAATSTFHSSIHWRINLV